MNLKHEARGGKIHLYQKGAAKETFLNVVDITDA